MKLLQLTFHFEFTDRIDQILDDHEIRDALRVPMVAGRDLDGKHDGSQVHPGSISAVWAQVPDDRIDDILDDLREFRRTRRTHQHLQALVLGIEQRIEDDESQNESPESDDPAADPTAS
jgi:hypothetical protein